ncbi:hypothetical protein H6G81_18215 [Scytonema hofmannii FACHB-248]|uniref:Bacteriocin n=1 Tax=Scytonema hofmannii FACHB-248 TaxID=1842502 RepID=A0ABR8GT65_9CYAN|nr:MULTISPECIES: hypothetical protein [Nostocales]MBD2606412.1 hypothetical protein [Scytonema hofmannii FACHB-248]
MLHKHARKLKVEDLEVFDEIEKELTDEELLQVCGGASPSLEDVFSAPSQLADYTLNLLEGYGSGLSGILKYLVR